MDENVFGMSIDDIHTNKSVNLANEYHFNSMDEEIAEIDKKRSSKATNVPSPKTAKGTKPKAK